ncbi:GNAT family N-acetyltransferase [Cohaesibacter gelatinilyticus]|uniref:Acetyltransferase (GNAT) domain-containing protein n=1 Tax=Cohaesibacter gelatinilyticus TaxID=372072 RepID=A0A285PIG9_9HYPH|nr:GNAT family N-acetyltransferase [Cohaesibacter gelatinilyticus]SNZ21522.1 Acetyltransferase (GNAT) domain-containing protein [Cohaesibacter gelatinilyticus]
MEIRKARDDDLGSLYSISLKTGHLGGDAQTLYVDPDMMGHIYSGPYLMLEPDLAFVIEHQEKVLGFCVGTLDTYEFACRQEKQWWPALRRKYPKPSKTSRSTWDADQRRAYMIHNPQIPPKDLCEAYPAHLHLNLLPEIQGQGVGNRLFEVWKNNARDLDAAAFHVGVNKDNSRAIRFWAKRGFQNHETATPNQNSRTLWMSIQY